MSPTATAFTSEGGPRWIEKNIKEKHRLKGSPEHQMFLADTLVLSLRNKIQCDFSQNIEI